MNSLETQGLYHAEEKHCCQRENLRVYLNESFFHLVTPACPFLAVCHHEHTVLNENRNHNRMTGISFLK